jgi:hypothetical protein
MIVLCTHISRRKTITDVKVNNRKDLNPSQILILHHTTEELLDRKVAAPV